MVVVSECMGDDARGLVLSLDLPTPKHIHPERTFHPYSNEVRKIFSNCVFLIRLVGHAI